MRTGICAFVPPPRQSGAKPLREELTAGLLFLCYSIQLHSSCAGGQVTGRNTRGGRNHLRHASMSSAEIYMAAAKDTDEVREWSLGIEAGE